MSIAIWAFCRFDYFAFYVIEHAVDGNIGFPARYPLIAIFTVTGFGHNTI